MYRNIWFECNESFFSVEGWPGCRNMQFNSCPSILLMDFKEILLKSLIFIILLSISF